MNADKSDDGESGDSKGSPCPARLLIGARLAIERGDLTEEDVELFRGPVEKWPAEAWKKLGLDVKPGSGQGT